MRLCFLLSHDNNKRSSSDNPNRCDESHDGPAVKKKNFKPTLQPQGVPFQPFFLPGHCRNPFSTSDPIYTRESPSKPVSLFELACGIARQHKERGEPIAEATRQWIEVPDWND